MPHQDLDPPPPIRDRLVLDTCSVGPEHLRAGTAAGPVFELAWDEVAEVRADGSDVLVRRRRHGREVDFGGVGWDGWYHPIRCEDEAAASSVAAEIARRAALAPRTTKPRWWRR